MNMQEYNLIAWICTLQILASTHLVVMLAQPKTCSAPANRNSYSWYRVTALIQYTFFFQMWISMAPIIVDHMQNY